MVLFPDSPNILVVVFTSINRKDFEEQPPTTWRVMSSDGVPAIYRCRMVLFLVERTYVCVCVCVCVCLFVCLAKSITSEHGDIACICIYIYIKHILINYQTQCVYIYIYTYCILDIKERMGSPVKGNLHASFHSISN